ncbi:MAG TPA: tyrosine-type recombinase/integrase, partial [Terracidiphilus sp.]|nr:tyrosine-type recombinase/integrase [Terracidiphilus sp.]
LFLFFAQDIAHVTERNSPPVQCPDSAISLAGFQMSTYGRFWVSPEVHFDEKGGKSREIPVRHDLEQMLFDYINAAGFRDAPRDTPLFRTAYRKTKRLTEHVLSGVDVCRMVKRRSHDAGLASRLSPHSFRVTTITDLLEQGVPLEEVQRLAGHADPRTTRLYDRRERKITRNIVERISI